MSDPEDRADQGLTPEQRQRALQFLGAHDRRTRGPIRWFLSRVRGADEYPLKIAAQWRFGATLVLVSIFTLGISLMLPDSEGQWMFFSFAWLILFVGIWHVDAANRKARRK